MHYPSKGVARTEAALVVLVVIFAGVAAAGWLQVPSQTAQTTTVTKTVTGGTGGASTVTVTSTVTSTGASQDLLACAQKEGAITVYGLVDTPDWNAKISPAWQAAYPWSKMSYLGLSAGDLVNKVLAEHKAGQVQADVVETFVNSISTLNSSGAIRPWSNPVETMMGYDKASLDPNNLFHPFSVYPSALVYNKNLVKDPSTLPKTWKDVFTSPQWKGEIAYQKPSSLGSTAGFLYWLSTTMDNQTWINFLKAAAANNPVQTDSQGQAFTDATTGQVALAFAGTNDIQAGLAKGAPIGVDWISPVFYQRIPIGIVAGSSHPCTAQLFLEWAASWAGQQAVGASLRVPWFPAAAAASPVLAVPGNLTAAYTDQPAFNNNQPYYGQIYKSIFGS